MSKKLKLIVYPVKDIEKAKEFYTAFFETEPYADSSYYVGYKIEELEIGLDPNSKVGPISYIDVENIKQKVKEMTNIGAQIVLDIKDVGNGLLIAQIEDTNGNIVGLRQGK